MRKLLAVLSLLLLTALAPTAIPAVTDFGHPAISRLWLNQDDAPDSFLCTGWYLAPVTVNKSWRWDSVGWLPDWSDNNRGVSWVVSAGHCADAYTIHRSPSDYVKGYIDWLAVLNVGYNTTHNTVDLAVGKVPDTREAKDRQYLELAPSDAKPGDTVYLHGFPRGVERIVVGQVNAVTSPEYPGSVFIKVKGREDGVWRGMSGAPVLNEYGQVIGVLWAIHFKNDPSVVPEPDPFAFPMSMFAGPEDVKWAVMTPVSRLRTLLKQVGVHGYHE